MSSDFDPDPYFNDMLRHGKVTIAELIENLRRFPQEATVRIKRDTLSVKYHDELYFLNADAPQERFQAGNAGVREDSVDQQLEWIKECGGDLEGYIDKYHREHGRTVENATEIYNADMAELERRKVRVWERLSNYQG